MTNSPQLLKGFRDYLPQEAVARKKIIAKISEVFERFGFAPIDTPALESYELFKGKLGEDEKLMYKFMDLGDREVSLRYDLTVPLARVISNYPDLPKPFKRYQVAPVWRADKPQKGRYREFMQCDIDIIGSDSVIADAEVIAALNAALKSLEIGKFIVKVNNRQLVNTVLKSKGFSGKEIANFLRIVDKIDKIGEKEVDGLLVEAGFKFTIDQFDKEVRAEGKDFVKEFEKYLDNFGVDNFIFDPTLARGLDYYTGIVFEFLLSEQTNFGSIAGGGRYDGLIEKISGKPMSAVGGSIGLDRLFAALTDAGLVASETAAEVMVFNLDKELLPEYLSIATKLRAAGIDTELYYETTKLDKQFKYAESKNVQLGVIYGPKEAKNRKVNLKNLQKKEQVTVELDDIVSQVKSMLR